MLILVTPEAQRAEPVIYPASSPQVTDGHASHYATPGAAIGGAFKVATIGGAFKVAPIVGSLVVISCS